MVGIISFPHLFNLKETGNCVPLTHVFNVKKKIKKPGGVDWNKGVLGILELFNQILVT